MRKGVIVGIIFLIIIFVVGILFAYSYTHLNVSLNNVEFQSIDWEELSWSTLLKVGLNTLSGDWFSAAVNLIQGINLNLILGLSNNGFLPVYIPDLTYDILINGIVVGGGNANLDVTINPGETKEIVSFQNLQKSSLSPAVYSIIDTKGIMDLKIKGTAYFKLFGFNIPVPFESSKQISIYDEVQNKINAEIQKNQPQNNLISSPVENPLESVLNSITNELFGPDDLELSLTGQTIVDATYKVSPNSYSYVPFTLQCTTTVQGGFVANAALGNDIIVFILDENNFREFENGNDASTYYNSNRVESGNFDVTLSSGEYYVVLSNEYSTFSTKTVQLQIATNC